MAHWLIRSDSSSALGYRLLRIRYRSVQEGRELQVHGRVEGCGVDAERGAASAAAVHRRDERPRHIHGSHKQILKHPFHRRRIRVAVKLVCPSTREDAGDDRDGEWR